MSAVQFGECILSDSNRTEENRVPYGNTVYFIGMYYFGITHCDSTYAQKEDGDCYICRVPELWAQMESRIK